MRFVIGIALALAACDTRSVQWFGLGPGRAEVSCDYSTLGWVATCIGGGRSYKCISEDGLTWRCAEERAP